MTPEEAMRRLSRSRFRSSFHLKEEQRQYIREKGLDTIERHCRDFVKGRLADADPVNDGKQTPMKGHPVFIAMHACGCCCRGCLEKWYRVPRHVPLTKQQQEKIVRFLMLWIVREYKKDLKDQVSESESRRP